MESVFCNQSKLNPLLLEAFELIKNRINTLSDVEPLFIEPRFSKIFRNLNKEELFIINKFYQAKGFRKIHLEVAKLGQSLQILHCVFFPDPCYELPIFGADLVVNSNNISAAIVDLSPVGKYLPNLLVSKIRSLKVPKFNEPGKLPEWGFIFSPYVCFIRPVNFLEEKLVLDLIDQYLSLLLSLLVSVGKDEINSFDTMDRLNYQKRYCFNQKRNEKTRGILTKLFGSSLAEDYINNILFDY